MTNSANLLDIAGQAYQAARRRYDTDVGNILELMNTQAALANAQQRRIQALTDWDYARVDLASKLGQLDATDIQANNQINIQTDSQTDNPADGKTDDPSNSKANSR